LILKTFKRKKQLLKLNNHKTQRNMKIDINGLLDGISNVIQVLTKIDFYAMVLGVVVLCLLVTFVAVLKHQ